MGAPKGGKNAYRRQQLKLKKQQQETKAAADKPQETTDRVEEPAPSATENGVAHDDTPMEIDTVDTILPTDDPNFKKYFSSVFKTFGGAEQQVPEEKDDAAKGQVYYGEDDNIFDEDEEAEQKGKLSRRKQKKEAQLTVAELKAAVARPDLVEWTDIDSAEPKLLVGIKSLKNIIPVPNHWSLKREYLSSKRGIEKAAFQLPKYIRDTGIQEMRDATMAKEGETSLKQQQRARVQGKVGKIDIEYGVLYDAFFRHQTKPDLSKFGELYFEGKEFETNNKHLKPGEMTEDLREALGMQPGFPTPWLINQQKFGPPPSYPGMKVPGVNAPPPPGGSWGFQPGQWGKPPVNDDNRPLFGGDVFGTNPQQTYQEEFSEPVEKTMWGELEELEPTQDEEEESDEDDDEEMGDAMDEDADEDVAAPVSGTSKIDSYGRADVSEPEAGDFALRKEYKPSGRQAYTVVGESQGQVSGFLGSDRRYDVQGAQSGLRPIDAPEESHRRKAGDVDVSVDVDALEGGNRKAEVQRLYDQQRRAEQPQMRASDADMDSLIAEGNAARLRKDQERRAERSARGGRR